jgi:hypothetical protein
VEGPRRGLLSFLFRRYKEEKKINLWQSAGVLYQPVQVILPHERPLRGWSLSWGFVFCSKPLQFFIAYPVLYPDFYRLHFPGRDQLPDRLRGDCKDLRDLFGRVVLQKYIVTIQAYAKPE